MNLLLSLRLILQPGFSSLEREAQHRRTAWKQIVLPSGLNYGCVD
jgi:hypothetical protein